MGVTTETVRKPKGVSAGAIVVAVVLLALVMGAAFYQQELTNYWRLQGWDTGAVKQAVERFVKEAHDGQASAGDLLDPKWAQPAVEGGKLVGVRHTGARGPTVTRFKAFIPDGTIKDCSVRIKNRSGVFQADVQYPNGQWAQFDVDRVKGALLIRSVPDALSPTRPQPQPWD
jgi:hypothetical protein